MHAALTEQAPVRRRLLGRHAEEQLADPVEVLGRGAGRSARAAGRLPRPPPPAPLTSLYMGSRRRDGWYCSHSTVNTVSLPLKRRREGTPLTSARPAPRARARGEPPHTHPSTASSRNQRKLSSGCTKGGPPSMDGCFRVYVENTTDALRLFFKQRNLRGGRGGTEPAVSGRTRHGRRTRSRPGRVTHPRPRWVHSGAALDHAARLVPAPRPPRCWTWPTCAPRSGHSHAEGPMTRTSGKLGPEKRPQSQGQRALDAETRPARGCGGSAGVRDPPRQCGRALPRATRLPPLGRAKAGARGRQGRRGPGLPPAHVSTLSRGGGGLTGTEASGGGAAASATRRDVPGREHLERPHGPGSCLRKHVPPPRRCLRPPTPLDRTAA